MIRQYWGSILVYYLCEGQCCCLLWSSALFIDFYTMLCEGRPGGACPDGKNDASVKLSQGDLMLCPSCEAYRFPEITTNKVPTQSTRSACESKTKLQTGTPVQAIPRDTTQHDKFVQCELLFFVNNTYGRHPETMIKSTITDFYREDEVMQAKQHLIYAAEKIDGLNIHSFAKNRIGSNKVKTSVDDIISITKLIDEGGYCDELPIFCAASMSRVALIADDQSDLTAIRMELCQLRQRMEVLSTQMSTVHQCKCTVTRKSPTYLDVQRESWNMHADDARDDHVTPVCAPSSARSHTKDDGTNPECNGHVNSSHDPDGVMSGIQSCAVSDNSDHPASIPGMASQRSFATTLQENMEGFHEVNRQAQQKRNRIQRKIVVGDLKSDAPFRGVAKKVIVCVSRLKQGTTVDMVTNYLRSKNINVLSCYEYCDKFDRFSFMRVCVSQSDANKMFISSMWPDGVVVRPWVFKARQTVANTDTAVDTVVPSS